jgi:hypothetical protein
VLRRDARTRGHDLHAVVQAAEVAVRDVAFMERPAVVRALAADGDLFLVYLADVADPQQVGRRIDPESPRIAQAPAVDARVRREQAELRAWTGAAGDHRRRHERVVVRDRAVQVHAQDLAVGLVEAGAVAVGRRRVVVAGVAHADVELTVVDDHAAAVVVGGTLEAWADDRSREVDADAAARVEAAAVDLVLVAVVVAGRGVEVERVVVVAHDAEQTLLAFAVHVDATSRAVLYAAVRHHDRDLAALARDHGPAIRDERDIGDLADVVEPRLELEAGRGLTALELRVGGAREAGRDTHHHGDHGAARHARKLYAMRPVGASARASHAPASSAATKYTAGSIPAPRAVSAGPGQ